MKNIKLKNFSNIHTFTQYLILGNQNKFFFDPTFHNWKHHAQCDIKQEIICNQ